MQRRPFRGTPTIQEVTCSGETLDSDINIYAMALFTLPSSRVLAFVDLKDNVCSTSSEFSACNIDVTDSHKTRLITLVQNLEFGEWREYGCNITSLRLGRAYLVSWRIGVTAQSTFNVLQFCVSIIIAIIMLIIIVIVVVTCHRHIINIVLCSDLVTLSSCRH